MKQTWQIVISLCLTAVIGYILYESVPDWSQAGSVMISGNLLWLFAGLGFVALHMFLRAVRWGLLLDPVKKSIPLKNLLSMTIVKYVINIIPPRVGEIAGSILLAKKEKIPASSVIASSMFERILDLLAVLVLFSFYLVFFAGRHMPSSETGREIFDTIRSSAIIGMGIIILGFIVLMPILHSRRWHDRVPAVIRKHLLSFLDGLRVMQNRTTAAKTIFMSLVIWMTICAQLWCLVRAYIDSFPITGAFLVMAVTVVGVTIPTPGGVGGYQFFMNLTLIHFFRPFLSELDAVSQVAGVSNGSYIVSMAPLITVGLILLHREGLSLFRASKLSSDR